MMDGADVVLVAGALLMRVLVGLSPYSGSNDPPKYGDYEAQRHWMELALGLPMREWYDDAPDVLARLGVDSGSGGGHHASSPSSSGRHWPLDYPPLSGYQSWLTGLAVRAVEPTAVALGARSHGHESPASKAAMRATVLLCDAAVFFPAAFWMAGALAAAGGGARRRRRGPRVRRAVAAVLLLNPALVLVDHGHFQYNCLSLGLALGAMAALVAPPPRQEENEEEAPALPSSPAPRQRRPGTLATRAPLLAPAPPVLPRRHLVAAVLFTLSLCHKQMGLYYAPAFFAHMLGGCLRDQPTWPRRAAGVAALGATVGATMAAALLPVVWGHRDGLAGGLAAVLARVFPLGRGLYEDYVANFWCATSVGPLKWRDLLGATPSLAVRVALAATVAAALPAMAQQVAAPSARGFLLCCANSAAAFFLFSFQVHEKSALLPLMPATLAPFALLLLPPASRPLSWSSLAPQSLSLKQNKSSSKHEARPLASAARGRAPPPPLLLPLLALLAVWGPAVACFGMFPLLERDGVAAAYAACNVVYVAVVGGLVDEALAGGGGEEGEDENEDERKMATAAAAGPAPSSLRRAAVVSAAVGGALALHAARLLYEPPARLPWLHDRLFVTYAFAFIALGAACLNWVQWGGGSSGGAGRPPRREPLVVKGAEEEEEVEEEEAATRAKCTAVAAARSPRLRLQRPREGNKQGEPA